MTIDDVININNISYYDIYSVSLSLCVVVCPTLDVWVPIVNDLRSISCHVFQPPLYFYVLSYQARVLFIVAIMKLF